MPPETKDAPGLLTIREVVDRSALSRRTIYSLIRSGELPSVKIGGARRVREDDLDRFIAERRQGGA